MSTPAATPDQGILCSVGPYPERQQDLEDRFYGKRLIYVAWENHLMYAAPFCVPLPAHAALRRAGARPAA